MFFDFNKQFSNIYAQFGNLVSRVCMLAFYTDLGDFFIQHFDKIHKACFEST